MAKKQAAAALARTEPLAPPPSHAAAALPPHGTGAPAPPNPMDIWNAAARIAPLLELTAARDDDPSLRFAEVIDRSLHYAMSRLTFGLSPMALAETYFDWLVHLSLSPGKQLQLWQKGARKSTRLASHLIRCATRLGADTEPCISPLPQDKRFDERGMAHVAVQHDPPELPAAAAVVVQRYDGHSRRIGPA